MEKICGMFLNTKILSVNPLGSGNINDTFLVKVQGESFILQRIQKRMDTEKLEYNFGLYSKILSDSGLMYPKWMKTKKGGYFYIDENEDRWRMYPYLDADILSIPLKSYELYECGRGLARLHFLLNPLGETPKTVYPMLHDLKSYYNHYGSLLAGGEYQKENRDRKIEETIELRIGEFIDDIPVRNAVVHGDPKLGNILFKEGKVVGFIDFDTVMQGSLLEDIADCIRSCCVIGGRLEVKAAEMIIKGYLAASKELGLKDTDQVGVLKTTGIEGIGRVFDRISFELALRYYTDALSPEKKFKEKYPGYRLERVRSLISLSWDGKNAVQ